MVLLRDKLKKNGKVVVLVTGCFDLLHLGHIKCLTEAKKLGDVLIVLLNNDDSVKTLKGPKRPIITQSERAEILAALSCVDYLIIFNKPTAENLLEKIKPDILVDDEFRNHATIESRTVANYGGKLVTAPYFQGYSTTALIKRILKLYCNGSSSTFVEKSRNE